MTSFQRGEPPPCVTVGDAVGRRETSRRDVAFDGPRHDAFPERHLRLEKFAIEMLRGAAVHGASSASSRRRIWPIISGIRVASFILRDTHY